MFHQHKPGYNSKDEFPWSPDKARKDNKGKCYLEEMIFSFDEDRLNHNSPVAKVTNNEVLEMYYRKMQKKF